MTDIASARQRMYRCHNELMEPVTHFLTGACLGRSGFNRKTAYATLAMTLAAEAPDLDVFWGFRGPVAAFEHHRGITHSFLAAPVIALVTTAFVWLVHKLSRKQPVIPPRWGLIWLFAMIADLSHLLLDYTNNYGIRPFYPFDAHWYAWNIVFIIEPVILLALLGALIMPWLLGLADSEIGARRKLFRGRGWAISALICMALVWAVRNAEHAHAIAVFRRADVTREAAIRVEAEPYPINPFLWRVMAETSDYYQTATVRTLSDQVQTDELEDIVDKPPVTLATFAAKRSWLGRVYLDWSKWPLVVDRGTQAPNDLPSLPPGASAVSFEDLRFAYSPVSASSHPEQQPPLSGWVYVGAQREIEGMFMGKKEQKP